MASLQKLVAGNDNAGVSHEIAAEGGKLVQKFDGAAQISKIADPTGGATTDAEARTAINAIIDALEAAGITADV